MQTQFKLDTSRFADCANSAKTLAEKLEDAILDCDRAIDSLYIDWMGKTRNEFEKKYKIFEQQVADIKNGLWELYEDIVSAEESYTQADTNMAKEMEGVTEGHATLSNDGS